VKNAFKRVESGLVGVSRRWLSRKSPDNGWLSLSAVEVVFTPRSGLPARGVGSPAPEDVLCSLKPAGKRKVVWSLACVLNSFG